MMNVSRKELIKELLMAALAAFISAVNLNSFVAAGDLVPAGFSGLALLITRIGAKYFSVDISYSILYVCLNVPAALLVYRSISKRFTLVSLAEVFLVSIFVSLLPEFTITDDMLLIAVFGGIIAGVSNSIIIDANACSGGLDFFSVYYSKKKGKSLWNQVFLVNVCVLCISGFLFGWEAALYSIIYQFVNTQMINLNDKRYKRSCLFVVTENCEPIIEGIAMRFQHTITVLDGVGGYSHEPKKMLYVVCGDYEVNTVCQFIQQVDPTAFINVCESKMILGNFHAKPY